MSQTGSRFNQRVINPFMARMAGSKYWYTALLRHTGRRSGKSYATPLMAMRVFDGFLIALPYGTNVDWLRNVQVAGRASWSDLRGCRSGNSRPGNGIAAALGNHAQRHPMARR